MNSLFLRLYFLIVATVIVVGIGLDFAWQYFDDQPVKDDYDRSLINIVSLQLDKTPEAKLSQQLKLINQHLAGEFTTLKPSDSLVTEIIDDIRQEGVFFIESGDDILGFSFLESHNLVLQLKQNKTEGSPLYKNIFVAVFYLLIAIMVFYWIWPLSKDLNQLENAVNQFDQQRWSSKVNLPATSSISHLAKAYNTLLDKIKLLVETQQAMSHSISHELRTPLARVRFSLQMAEESKNIDEVKEQINSIAEDIEEMNQLINELLNFASLENISVKAILEKGDLNTLIETLITRLQKNFPDNEISFNKKTKQNNILCDSYLMERALQNLIVNACKFAERKVVVSFVESGNKYQILVEDDGSGIPDESKNKVFDSFVQLESKNKNRKNGKGFGLGLAIVKRVMMLHNGTAKVENSSLGGAKFIISWSTAR